VQTLLHIGAKEFGTVVAEVVGRCFVGLRPALDEGEYEKASR